MIKRVRGTKDVFGGDILKWQEIEDNIRNVCQVFGYDEIRTPTFEYTELFNRSVGEKTDIVQKEMYTFLDKGGRSISLKPEGTAGAARAYLENKLYAQGLPLKLYYITPAFRYEKPASGRLREFHQFGVELYGIKGIDSEVEVISLCHDFFTRIGSLNVDLEINNIGSFETRQVYISHLKEYISHNLDMFCDDCKHRYNINPLRIFDCKIETCQSLMKKAPVVLNYLDDKSRSDFDSLKATLTAMNIEYKVNDRLVRGLDYYTDVVFEFVLNDYALGSQSTVCGGGRYNCLIGELGGDNISCVGFSVGIERLISALDIYNKSFKKAKSPLIYIGHMGGESAVYAHKLAYNLRTCNVYSYVELLGRSIKAQARAADKIDASYLTIIGDNELRKDRLIIKNMESGKELDINLDEVFDFLNTLRRD